MASGRPGVTQVRSRPGVAGCFALLLVTALPGCGTKAPPPEPAVEVPSARAVLVREAPAPDITAKDAVSLVGVMVQVEVSHVRVPLGAVSADRELWKLIDETAVEAPTYELLVRNGVRVGMLPEDQLTALRQRLAEHSGSVKVSSFRGARSEPIAIETAREIPEQEIFYFDAQNLLSGRSFRDSRNSIAMSFEPAPRKLGTVRLVLTPRVQWDRRRLEFNAFNQERERLMPIEEHLFDLNLRVDVPPGMILVVAPSPDAQRSTSLGNRFLISDDGAQRIEQMLLIQPRTFKLERE